MAKGIYPGNKGKIPWNKGLKASPETREKQRLAKLGKPAPWMKGNKYIAGEKNPNYGKFGPKHPKWVDFKKHTFHKAIRSTYKYRQWRSDVFTRDNFTCVLCGKNRCYIEADHFPKMFAQIVMEYNIKTVQESLECEELWNINNGRTLCKPCHDPTRGKRIDLTKLKIHG